MYVVITLKISFWSSLSMQHIIIICIQRAAQEVPRTYPSKDLSPVPLDPTPPMSLTPLQKWKGARKKCPFNSG